MPDTIYQNPRPAGRKGEVVVTSTCGHNCGGRCVVNAHVVDDKVVRISTDPARWQPELPPLHACARGVGQIERLYHKDRLKYPMRRTGPRGSGQYERISWDEALDHVAREMRRIRDQYGNAAFLDASRSGNTSALHGFGVSKRFFNKFGGCTLLWSNMSAEAEIFAVRMTFGAKADYKSAGREPTDYVNSKLILMWGWSPADGTFGTGTYQYLKEAKKKGVRIVCVDPRRTRTSQALADEHIFIKPSTDAAALIAMAYVIVSEGLHDQAYCDRHVLGFDEAHLPAGAPRARPTSPTCWARATACRRLPNGPPSAAASRPRPSAGSRSSSPRPSPRPCNAATPRAARPSASSSTAPPMRWRRSPAMSASSAAIPASATAPPAAPASTACRPAPTRSTPGSRRRCWPTCWRSGKAGGYPADIKMIYSAGGDLFNQAPNANKMARSLDGVELIVAQDHFLTPTARHADIVLPATTFWERNDVHTPWAGAGHYAIYMKQAIEPMYECRNDMAIFADLAARLGINDYDDRTEEQWLRELTKGAVDDFEAFRENGVARFAAPEGRGGLRRSRSAIPTTTSSRRRRARSRSTRWRWPPSPIPTAWARCRRSRPGSSRSSRTRKYPLMLCSPKSRARTHSIHGNQPLLARVDPDDVWMNPADARARGIADGQTVRVFNDRGSTLLPVKVTPRIAQGVVSIKEGAWFTPDDDGTDTEGCANVLAEDRSAPCGATTYNTNLVEVAAVN